MNPISEQVHAARLARNMTQADLALRAGVCRQTVQRIEAGKHIGPFDMLERVCRELGLTIRLEKR